MLTMQRTIPPAYITCLLWLVYQCGGVADNSKLAKKIVHTRKGGPVKAMLNGLEKHGWATVEYVRPNGVDGTTTVTAAGALFADFLMTKHPDWDKLDKLELHGWIRALQLTLRPFAALGERLKSGKEPFLNIQIASLGLSALQCELAAEVLAGDNSRVTFPWTPGRLRRGGKQR